MRKPILLTVGVVSFVVAGLSARQSVATDSGLTPLIGLWRAGADAGEPTFTIDGTAAPKPNDEHARRYFGADAPTFVKAASTPTIFPLAVAHGITGFGGGAIRVDFKLLAGATDQTAGVAFNILPDHSYLYARYNTKDGNVALWKYENGERTVLAHGELHEQLPFGVWHTLTVNVSGRVVTATVNDKFRVHYTVDRDVQGGVGLWTKADSVTAFRRFAATAR
jgi:hypothetical protein